MWPDPGRLAGMVSEETGLAFDATTGVDADRQRWYLLRPRGVPEDHSFGIRTTIEWKRLRVAFEPGKFAAELLARMSDADASGRAVFMAILRECAIHGAHVELRVDDVPLRYESSEVWSRSWRRFSLILKIGPLELMTEHGEGDAGNLFLWTGRLAAAIVAILPLEKNEVTDEDELHGYPEGAMQSAWVNRYERDRRNRAAAIAIHGRQCLACGLDFNARYGELAAGFIEVHHTTPVSKLGPGYVIDPATDLIPLCPNCHVVVHRRDPPLTVAEVREILAHYEAASDKS